LKRRRKRALSRCRASRASFGAHAKRGGACAAMASRHARAASGVSASSSTCAPTPRQHRRVSNTASATTPRQHHRVTKFVPATASRTAWGARARACPRRPRGRGARAHLAGRGILNDPHAAGACNNERPSQRKSRGTSTRTPLTLGAARHRRVRQSAGGGPHRPRRQRASSPTGLAPRLPTRRARAARAPGHTPRATCACGQAPARRPAAASAKALPLSAPHPPAPIPPTGPGPRSRAVPALLARMLLALCPARPACWGRGSTLEAAPALAAARCAAQTARTRRG